MIIEMSANQLWKQQQRSGETKLQFLPWLEREKAKAYFNYDNVAVPINSSLNDSVQRSIYDMRKIGGLKTDAGKEYVLGINREYLIYTGISVGVVVLLIGGYIVYKKFT